MFGVFIVWHRLFCNPFTKTVIMKTLKTVVLLIAMGLVCPQLVNKAKATPPPPVSVSFQVFYDDLSPHGRWVSYPQYGYVWVPGLGPDFVPYATGGHWEYSDDYGWVWASDYDWGWAPFHYGRWFYEDAYGWMWAPGYDWAPAWVTWGSYGDYYGWAPLAPGVSISVGYRPPARYWTFVPHGRITAGNVYNYRVNNTTVVNNINNVTVINNSRVYNNNHYFAGPKAAEVEHTANIKVNHVNVVENSKPGPARTSGNQLAMYRPTVTKSTSAAPTHIEKLENVRSNNRPNTAPAPAINRGAENKALPNNTPRNNAAKPAENKPGNIGQPREKPTPAAPKAIDRNQPARPTTPRENKAVERPQQPIQHQAPAERAQPRPSAPPVHNEPRQQMPQQRNEPRQQMPSPRSEPRQQMPPQHSEPPRQQPQMHNEPPHQQPMQQQPMHNEPRPMSPPLRETRPMSRPGGPAPGGGPGGRPHQR